MVAKKRRIAKKPTEQTPDSWVAAGGVDPEISETQTPQHSDVQTPKHSDAQTSKRSNAQTSKRSNAQTSKRSNAQTSGGVTTEKTAKSKRTDYTRATIYIPKTLHKRMKMAQLTKELEMSEIAEEAITTWLDALDV